MNRKKAIFIESILLLILFNAGFVSGASDEKDYLTSGDNYMKQGKYEKAVKEFKKAVELNPQSADANYCLGAAYFNVAYENRGSPVGSKGEFDESIKYYKKAIEINPMHAEAYSDIGFAYVSVGKLRESIPYLEKAIKLDPDLVTAYNNLGVTYNELHRPNDAIPYLQKAIQVNPDYWQSYANLGLSYYYLGVAAKSNESFDKAKELMKNNKNERDRRLLNEYLSKVH